MGYGMAKCNNSSRKRTAIVRCITDRDRRLPKKPIYSRASSVEQGTLYAVPGPTCFTNSPPLVWNHLQRTEMRLNASALQLALVVSLLVTAVIGSLIYLFQFYRDQDNRMARWDRIDQGMQSALSLVLSNEFGHTDTIISGMLYQEDSVRIVRQPWGFYDRAHIVVWEEGDTLRRSFLIGQAPSDSTVLYVRDEDRPLSISGASSIRGTAWLPGAGIRPAFVDGGYYEGDEKMVQGKIRESARDFPAIDATRIAHIRALFDHSAEQDYTDPHPMERKRSFAEGMRLLHSSPDGHINRDSILGHTVVVSDSALVIPASCYVEDALFIAPYIRIEDGFAGKAQFFALDSLHVGDRCAFHYPSALGLLTEEEDTGIKQLHIGDECRLSGIAFLYSAAKEDQVLHHLVLGKDCRIVGELVSFGMLRYEKPLQVTGSTHCYRFLTQTPSSLYENYLIDLTLDRPLLSPYFMASLFWPPGRESKQNVVRWLD